MGQDVPIACDLGVFSTEEQAEHQRRVEKVVLGQALSISEEENGFHLRYAVNEETLLELSRWIAKESRCCPFLKFRMDVSGPSNEIELRLIGNKAAKDFVRMTLSNSRR